MRDAAVRGDRSEDGRSARIAAAIDNARHGLRYSWLSTLMRSGVAGWEER